MGSQARTVTVPIEKARRWDLAWVSPHFVMPVGIATAPDALFVYRPLTLKPAPQVARGNHG